MGCQPSPADPAWASHKLILIGAAPPPWAFPTGSSSGPGLFLWGHPWAVAPSGLILCCTVGSSVAAQGDLLCVAPTVCGGTACSSVGLSWAARSCCSAPRAPPALLGACRAAALSFLLPSPSCCCTVLPFLNSALPEHTRCGSWLSCGSSRSLLEQLELAVV